MFALKTARFLNPMLLYRLAPPASSACIQKRMSAPSQYCHSPNPYECETCECVNLCKYYQPLPAQEHYLKEYGEALN